MLREPALPHESETSPMDLGQFDCQALANMCIVTLMLEWIERWRPKEGVDPAQRGDELILDGVTFPIIRTLGL